MTISNDFLEKLLTIDFYQILTLPFAYMLVDEMRWYFRNRLVYGFSDAMSSLSCGILTSAFVFTILPLYSFVEWMYLKFSYFKMETLSNDINLALSILLLFLIDHSYYWGHRFCHESNLGWACHETHHQSEDYKLTTALRNNIFQPYITLIFYLPWLMIGYPVEWFISQISLVGAYQFWLHTERIKKLPAWFEYIFNSPSHHRVHHALNSQYINKNYGGIFIFWDRIYGTFAEENEYPIYGTTKPIQTWNPLYCQISNFKEIVKNIIENRKFIRIWFENPSKTFLKYDSDTSSSLNVKNHTKFDCTPNLVKKISTILLLIFSGTLLLILSNNSMHYFIYTLVILLFFTVLFIIGKILD
ncbi:MAG: sterol desaturase family protein [Pseudomonadota bacterium]